MKKLRNSSIYKLCRNGLIVVAVVPMTVSCGPTPKEQIRDLKKELQDQEFEKMDLERICEYGPDMTPQERIEKSYVGARSGQAELDLAIGENVDDFTPEQEWEIRKDLGAELGVPPSEVNGWKEIYKARARNAKKDLEIEKKEKSEREAIREEKRLAACEELEVLKTTMQTNQDKLDALERL